MTLYIDGYKNTNFQKFVDFADTKVKIRKGNTIARLGDTAPNLTERSITAFKKDGVGGFSALFRTKTKEAVNNATRENFKNAIIDLFGGMNNVPDSVLEAMKLKDFGHGKPLTARRIMAVKNAIDNVKTRFDNALQTAKANTASMYQQANAERKAQIDADIRNIIESCIDNPDLLDIVVNNMDSILVGGDGKYRSEASIKKRIDNLKDNFAELRELAKDNPSVLEPGKFFIAAMNGKAIPKGMIRTIVQEVKKVPIKEMAKLSASSSGYGIHKAMNQFRNGINDIMNKADVENAMDGTDEKVACRDFAVQLIMARCGKGAPRKMQAALNSETAAKTLRLYNDINNGLFDKTGMSDGHIKATRQQGDSHQVYFMQLKQAVDMACGIPRDDFIPLDAYEEDFDYDEIDGDKIFTKLTNEGRSQLDTIRENFLANNVQGTGNGVAELRTIFENKLGPDVLEPQNVIRENTRPILKNMINLALLADCKRFAEGRPEDTMFHQSLAGGMVVKLPDGKQLSNDFDTARDEITKFLTGDANATYKGADKKTQAKAHIVMSLISQATMKAALDGNALALDPKKARPAFNMETIQNPKAWMFTLDMTKIGGLFIDFKANLEINSFTTMSDNHEKKIETGKGSTYNSQFRFQLHHNELDRLADQDYTQYNEQEAENTFNTAETDKATNTVNSLPQEFKLDRINAGCDTNFNFTLA